MTISKLINVLKMCVVLEESYNPITKAKDKEFYKKISTKKRNASVKYVANTSYVWCGKNL